MTRSYGIFVGLFLATTVLFILGVVRGSLPLISLAFVVTLALYVVRRVFMPNR